MLMFKWLLLLVLSPAFLLQTVLAATPQNPLLTKDALFVSNNGVHKFNRTTLERKWSALQGLQTFEPVMGKHLLYVGSTQGLYALDPDTGQQVWRIEDSRTLFSPTVAQQIYAGSLHGVLYSIKPANGNINWRQQFSGWIYSPVVQPDQNQLWTGGQDHEAFALSIDDGRPMHRIALNQESVFSPVDLQNNRIAFNLFNGKTAIINTVTAKIESWLNGSTQPKNLIFDDRFIYRSSRDGELTAFDRKTYRQSWQEPVVGRDLTIHPSSAGQILLSDLGKILVLFDPQNRGEIWRSSIPGNWFSPIQIDRENIIYFHSNNLQPNLLTAVKISAQLPN
jgi:outer membrane protein assembly factor BamB